MSNVTCVPHSSLEITEIYPPRHLTSYSAVVSPIPVVFGEKF